MRKIRRFTTMVARRILGATSCHSRDPQGCH